MTGPKTFTDAVEVWGVPSRIKHNDHATTRLAHVIRSASSPQQVSEAMDEFVRVGSPVEVAARFVSVCADLDAEILGYVVFPPLRRHLRADPGLLHAFVDLVTRGRGSQAFRVVLLDFADDAVRHGRTSVEVTDALLKVALTPRQGPLVRARAARSIIRTRDARVTRALQRLLRERNVLLVDVAAHGLVERQRRWRDQRVSFAPLVAFARAHPREALRGSGLLRALASSALPSARAVLRDLASHARQPADVARLASAAASRLDARSRVILAETDPTAFGLIAPPPITIADPLTTRAIRFPDGKSYRSNELREALESAMKRAT